MMERTMSATEFLVRAERYAEARGDYQAFTEKYCHYRLNYGVRDSAWMALDWFYGQDSANLVEQCHHYEVGDC
jgi:hypothetical protein